jgi:hypothetical protein
MSRGIQSARMYVPSYMEWNPHFGLMVLKLPRSNFKKYEAGQYFFVNIPEITMNEWHPFTASAVLDNEIVFYIKRVKKSSLSATRVPWTHRLALMLEGSLQYPAIRLSGPFGHTDFHLYENVLLFAGGIGITPMIASFTTFLRDALEKKGRYPGVKCVVLVWNSPSSTDFKIFEEVFSLASGSISMDLFREKDAPIVTDTCTFHIRLHCTKISTFSTLSSTTSFECFRNLVTKGRCRLETIFESFGTNDARTVAAACGPSTLSYEVSRLAWLRGTDFHAEQFAF